MCNSHLFCTFALAFVNTLATRCSAAQYGATYYATLSPIANSLRLGLLWGPQVKYNNIIIQMNEKERIDQVIKSVGMTARQFATEIHVQPGTISNMMAGRNNPSLDVMRKILQRYPTLNPEWLILGKGDMWRTEPGKEPGLFDRQAPDPKEKVVRTVTQKEEPQVSAAPPKQISRIVVYYTDNTFEEFYGNSK